MQNEYAIDGHVLQVIQTNELPLIVKELTSTVNDFRQETCN